MSEPSTPQEHVEGPTSTVEAGANTKKPDILPVDFTEIRGLVTDGKDGVRAVLVPDSDPLGLAEMPPETLHARYVANADELLSTLEDPLDFTIAERTLPREEYRRLRVAVRIEHRDLLGAVQELFGCADPLSSLEELATGEISDPDRLLPYIIERLRNEQEACSRDGREWSEYRQFLNARLKEALECGDVIGCTFILAAVRNTLAISNVPLTANADEQDLRRLWFPFGVSLEHSSLRRTNLQHACLTGYARDTSFEGASFRGTRLDNFQISGGSVAGADFGGAILRVEPRNPIFQRGVDVTRADFRETEGLLASDFRNTMHLGEAFCTTTLRRGLTAARKCPNKYYAFDRRTGAVA